MLPDWKLQCSWTVSWGCSSGWSSAVRRWESRCDSRWPSILSKHCWSVGDDTTADRLVSEEAACWAVSHVNLAARRHRLWGSAEWGSRLQDDKISRHAEEDTAGMPGMSGWITRRHHARRRTLVLAFQQSWLDWNCWWMLFSSVVQLDHFHAKEIIKKDSAVLSEVFLTKKSLWDSI